MPQIKDNDVRKIIKQAAGAHAPDVWAGIERSIIEMEQNKMNHNKPVKRFARWGAAVAACAVLAVAAVALATRPAFLFGAPKPSATVSAATPDAQIRQPVPFAESTTLTKQGGRTMDIKFYETLNELAQSKWAKDIAEFELVKQTGSVPADGGLAMYSYYEMKAVKVLKGSLKPGDTVTVRTFGGASDSVWVEDDFIERFTKDFSYLFFLDSFTDEGKTVYQLASPLQGYVPLRCGAVSLNTKIAENGLFKHGEALADLEKRIEEALK